ncbi:MAG: nuclear transport factor 2 family protein [Actinomycetota bacterium]
MAEHPNAERVRRGYEAFASGDMDTVSELMADDIVWHVGGNNSISGDYKGKKAVFGFLGRLVQETGGTLRQEVHDILANDEHVVVLLQTSAERNGVRSDQRAVDVMHVGADGKIAEFWRFPEDSAAIDKMWS